MTSSVGKLHVIGTTPAENAPWLGTVKQGTGSCVFLNQKSTGAPAGKIHALTCAHVIANAHPSSGVTFSLANSDDRYPAKVLGSRKAADTAILEMDTSPELMKAIKPLELGKDRDLRHDDELTAVGFSLGFPHAKATPMKLEWRNRTNGLLELDGGANPGMSGGAVLRDDKVVGLVRSKVGGSEGMTFATPASHMLPMVQSVAAHKHEDLGHRELPFSMVVNNKDYMDFRDLSEHGEGILAHSVKDAALAEGDVLLQVRDPHDKAMRAISYSGSVRAGKGDTLLSLGDVIQQLPHGQQAEFLAVSPGDRNKAPRSIFVSTERRPEMRDLSQASETFGLYATEVPRAQLEPVLLSATAVDTDKKPPDSVMMVGSIYPGSYLRQHSPLGSGQVIRSLNGRAVQTLDEYREALSAPVEHNGEDYVHLETVCGQGCRFETAVRLQNLRDEIPLVRSLGVSVADQWAGGLAVRGAESPLMEVTEMAASGAGMDDDSSSEASAASSASARSEIPPAFKVLLQGRD